MNIVVLGSGGWGTALAMLLEQNRHTVTLWSHDPKKAEQLKLKRENPLLPGVQLPVELQITNDLNCLKDAELVVFAPPSFALRAVAKEAAPYLPNGVPLLSVTKARARHTSAYVAGHRAGDGRGASHRRALGTLARGGGRARHADRAWSPRRTARRPRSLFSACLPMSASASIRMTTWSAWSLPARSRTWRRCAAA